MAEKELINILESYADSLLDHSGYEKLKQKASRKKRKLKNISNEGNVEIKDNSQSASNSMTARKRKRLRQKRNKKSGNSDEIVKNNSNIENDDKKAKPVVKTEKSRRVKLLLECGVTDGNMKNGRSNVNVDEERKSIKKQTLNKSIPEVVVHADHIPKKRKFNDNVTDDIVGNVDVKSNVSTFNMRKARHDVLKLGISGFDKVKKEEAKIALAVRLGAKPPKNECINYKEMIERRKEEKKLNLTSLLEGQMKSKSKKSKPTKKLRTIDGQIGRYKNGMQIIEKEDIRRIRKQRHRK